MWAALHRIIFHVTLLCTAALLIMANEELAAPLNDAQHRLLGEAGRQLAKELEKSQVMTSDQLTNFIPVSVFGPVIGSGVSSPPLCLVSY